jgi:toxin HigB-1
MPIQSFSCKDTMELFTTGKFRKFANFSAVAERKLQMLDSAATLEFLKSPPGNRLEALSGNRAGQHSIRINDQWRVCFGWTAEGPKNVEIVDYH